MTIFEFSANATPRVPNDLKFPGTHGRHPKLLSANSFKNTSELSSAKQFKISTPVIQRQRCQKDIFIANDACELSSAKRFKFSRYSRASPLLFSANGFKRTFSQPTTPVSYQVPNDLNFPGTRTHHHVYQAPMRSKSHFQGRHLP